MNRATLLATLAALAIPRPAWPASGGGHTYRYRLSLHIPAKNVIQKTVLPTLLAQGRMWSHTCDKEPFNFTFREDDANNWLEFSLTAEQMLGLTPNTCVVTFESGDEYKIRLKSSE